MKKKGMFTKIILGFIVLGVMGNLFGCDNVEQENSEQNTVKSVVTTTVATTTVTTTITTTTTKVTTTTVPTTTAAKMVVQDDAETRTAYVAQNGHPKSKAYWYNIDNMPANTNKAKVVTMTEAEAKARGLHHSLKE